MGGTMQVRGGIVGPQPSPSAGLFPRLAVYSIGGTRDFYNSTLQTYFKLMNTVILGWYDGWESATGHTQASVTTAIQSGALHPNGAKIFSYYDALVQNAGPGRSVQLANNMLLVQQYASNLTPVLTGSSNIGNICLTGTQPTVTSGSPAVTRNANQYQADYLFDYTVNGNGLGLASNLPVANPTLNGWYLDDTNCYTSFAGDWLRNNTTQAGANDSTTAQSIALRQGWAAFVDRLKVNKSNAIVIGNLSGLYNSPQTSFFVDKLDGGIAEHMIGWVNSQDNFTGWSGMMGLMSSMIDFTNAAAPSIFHHLNVTNDGRDFYRTTAYQGVRYGLGSALLAGCDYAISPTAIAGNVTLTNAFTNSEYDTQKITGSGQWFDEFSVNPSTLIAYGYGAGSISSGLGWMGTRIDSGVITSSWNGSGLMRCRFLMANGNQAHVFLNPTGSTINSGALGATYRALTGTQAPSVNNGATGITSISVPAFDARFLVTP